VSHKNVYYIFNAQPHGDDEVHRKLLGKFWLGDGNLKVLEDHGIGRDLEKLSPEKASSFIHSLTQGQRTEVVNADDLRNGHHPNLLPDISKPRSLPTDLREAMEAQAQKGDSGPRTSHFEYHREGLPAPQHLELKGSKGFLDGHALGNDELQAIRDNANSGKARLKLKKSEAEFGDEDQKLIHEDTLVPGAGNLYSYRKFLASNPPGVHVHINGKDIDGINRAHGIETGNEALAALGRTIVESAAEGVGKDAKVFRVGGDKFHVHVPDRQSAAVLARVLRTNLEAIPTVRGTHRLDATVGYGETPEVAAAALSGIKK
jgi:hypothetical protein